MINARKGKIEIEAVTLELDLESANKLLEIIGFLDPSTCSWMYDRNIPDLFISSEGIRLFSDDIYYALEEALSGYSS